MKSQSEIERRLKNLRARYARKFVTKSQLKSHENCQYNHIHEPISQGLTNKRSEFRDVGLAPRKQVTLLVFQEEFPVRLCMYGSNNPATWNGDVCDDDNAVASCKYFKPTMTSDLAQSNFDSLMEDDEYVFNNYRDIATLQWVLNMRVFQMKYSLFSRIKRFILKLFTRKTSAIEFAQYVGSGVTHDSDKNIIP